VFKEAKEDYQLLMKINSDNLKIEKVRCKIYLPKRNIDPIKIYFYPTQEQVVSLIKLFEFSIEGEIKNIAGDIIGKVEATKVYNNGTITENFGSDIVESIFMGEPIDLKISMFSNYESNNSNYNDVNTVISFWLTPNILLSPAQLIERSYTGRVEIRTVRRFEFTLANGIPLVFNNHFRYVENPEGDVITFDELVAECTVDSEVNNLEDIIDSLDDFLVIVSFATRQRCICLGWSASNSKEYTRFYRRSLSIPMHTTEPSINDTLVDITQFQSFIDTTYNAFINIEQRVLIRKALQFSISARDKTVESSFTTLYSVLETLVLDYRRQNELEFVLDEDNWNEFEKGIKKWIKQQPQFVSFPEKRKLIYEKLKELNRISFSNAFKKFCISLELDLQDLWTVTGGKGSLTEIRNKLVHGETFNRSQEKSLIVALHHLTWIVERAILSVLSWSISDSRVSQNFLNKYITLYHNWESERQLITNSPGNINFPVNTAPQDEV